MELRTELLYKCAPQSLISVQSGLVAVCPLLGMEQPCSCHPPGLLSFWCHAFLHHHWFLSFMLHAYWMHDATSLVAVYPLFRMEQPCSCHYPWFLAFICTSGLLQYATRLDAVCPVPGIEQQACSRGHFPEFHHCWCGCQGCKKSWINEYQSVSRKLIINSWINDWIR